MNGQVLKEEHIRCRVIIEVLGKPKEHVEKTLKDYAASIKEDSDFIILKEEFSDAVEHEKMFSVFVELEMVVKGIAQLIGFCFDYMPSSVEIIKPENVEIKNNILSALFNDLQARLHKVDMIVKQQKGEIDFLKRNLNRALKNQIFILVKMRQRTQEELSRLTGIGNGDLKLFLEQMIEAKEIKKENDHYQSIK